jgi:hypothetical protein
MEMLPEYRPLPGIPLRIQSHFYEFVPHTILPNEVQHVVRERASIYQLRRLPDRSLWALKVSHPGYRDPRVAQHTAWLQQCQHLPGLRTAGRISLTRATCPELLGTQPALEWAVLMPWIEGPTWAGFMDDAQLSVAYTMQQAQDLALTLAYTLWCLQTHHLTHTDIAGDNVIVISPTRIEFIDIDGMYQHGTQLPPLPGRGWRGYQHRNLDQRGHCRPDGDRFAGAILLTEMLTWWNPLIRALTEGDSLFERGAHEPADLLHKHLKAVRTTLRQIHPELRTLFLQAWNSHDLAFCPDFSCWLMAILRARSGY